jgi:hypothetical protein
LLMADAAVVDISRRDVLFDMKGGASVIG